MYFTHRKVIRTVETNAQWAVMKHVSFRATLKRAGFNLDAPYVLEVNPINETVFFEQNGAEVAATWQQINDMNKPEPKWGGEDVAW